MKDQAILVPLCSKHSTSPGRTKSVRTISVADFEQQALLLEKFAIYLCERHAWIPDIDRFSPRTVDLDDAESLAVAKSLERFEAENALGWRSDAAVAGPFQE